VRAKEFAHKRHNGHLRENGEFFFNHVHRVAMMVMEKEVNPTYIAAAYLHDVVEDGKATLAEVYKLFGVDVGEIVRLLTRQLGISYEMYIKRIAISGNRGAILIKIADNEDNIMCLGDGAFDEEKEHKLMTKWFWAWSVLN